MYTRDLALRRRLSESAIREAGKLALRFYEQRESLVVDRKGIQDLVSEADRRCETVIVEALSGAFPEDGFVGEEGASRNLEAEAIWVIDPIDGTHNFLTGIPFWCVSIGLVSAGRPILGLIYDPLRDELFSAAEGSGAFLDGLPMRVTGETDLTRARVCVGFSYRRPIAAHVRALEALLDARCEYLRLGSGALALAYVAAGRFEAYWELHHNPWDAAAGLALVKEAGGWINDFFEGDGLRSGNEVLASTPALADELKVIVGFGSR